MIENIPHYLKDSPLLITQDGFQINHVWYHGTSSALVHDICLQGLKRSGDQALTASEQKIMATIGNQYQEVQQPVFLTPSKSLAFYWAQACVKRRYSGHTASIASNNDEQPAVLEVALNPEIQSQVQPDVGAMTLLMLDEGEAYLQALQELYNSFGLVCPEIDLQKMDRMAFLKTLGMAYLDADIESHQVRLLQDPNG